MQLPLPEQPEDLPNWAQALIYLGMAVGGGLSVFVARLGILSGRKANGQPIELAGAVIDRETADELIEALRKNTAAHERLTELLEDVRLEMRDLTHEIIRAGRP